LPVPTVLNTDAGTDSTSCMTPGGTVEVEPAPDEEAGEELPLVASW
jgi:hypothetical protein